MGYCKIIEKCKKCQYCAKQRGGLAEKFANLRPAERVVERTIVELSTRCEPCGCKHKEAESANERS